MAPTGRIQWLAAVTVAVVNVGCWMSESKPGTVGEMGMGFFEYRCVDEGDAVCNVTDAADSHTVAFGLGVNGQVPAAIAVGARFDLHYWGNGPNSDSHYWLPIQIVPARPEVVYSTGGFSMKTASTVAFLARNPQGITADFVHLSAEEIDDVELWVAGQRVNSINLATPGSSAMAAAVPVDRTGLSLAGAIPCSWSSSNEQVVQIGPAGTTVPPAPGIVVGDDEIRIMAVAAGQATVRFETGSIHHELTVTVDSP